MLLLCPPSPDIIESLPLIISSTAEPVHKAVEPAGKAYHDYCCSKLGISVQHEVIEDSTGDDVELDKKFREKHRKRLDANELLQRENDEVNLYDVLGLGDIGFSASQKQIKKAYQKMILVHHPDKQASEDKTEENEAFLLVQKAWDILGNVQKRRGYDSSFDFDDSIPSGFEVIDNDEAFYEIFTEVFARNARFSVNKPVPGLGDNETSSSALDSFYQFWSKFESWREFSKFDEFKDGDLENASSRYERRWMQKQNDNQRAKKKKKEYERIRLLVERCRKADPRIQRRLKEEAERKERLKQEKLAEEKAAEERRLKEARLLKEAEERRKVEENKLRAAKKLAREQKKNMVKILKDSIITMAGSGVNNTFLGDLEYLVKHDVEIVKDIEQSQNHLTEKEIVETIHNEAQKVLKKREAIEREKTQTGSRVAKSKEKKNVVTVQWSNSELSALAKAVKKFPGGTRKRWQVICEYVNNNESFKLGRERREEECIAMVKKLGESTQKINQQDAFKSFQERKDKKKSSSSVEWSSEEQKLLEQALKQFTAKLEKNERWSKISAHVKTKTKRECVERYKFLRNQLLKKKQQK